MLALLTSAVCCVPLPTATGAIMNNFTFGDDRHQYYETVAGGSGAGPDFDGADVVQTHMPSVPAASIQPIRFLCSIIPL